MEIDIQEKDIDYGCIPIEFDASGYPVGITVEEWFDKLDARLIDHFGEDFRLLANERRLRWNKDGTWNFRKM